jgi:flagellar assembly protein FliH
MSRRARILASTTVLDLAEWSNGPRAAAPSPVARLIEAPRPSAMHGAVGTPVGTATAAASATGAALATAPAPDALPAAGEAVSHEHQARLAALEREAFTKGYAQGERAGLEAGGKRAEAMLRRVAQTIEELGGLRQTLVHETERQMVQLALTLARRVVHREVTLDPELAAALAHVALERLGTTAPATIRMNPEDYTIVAEDASRWSGTPVTVVPDPSIARGGCLVESEFGSVDATIERQFDELTRALFAGH